MSTSVERSLYLDSSALVKLVVSEGQSEALRSAIGAVRSRVSCALARVEVVRAVRGRGTQAVNDAHAVLESIELIEMDGELLNVAAELDAPLRSLDAIHVAAAMELGDELGALVTYDARMASAARALGVPVVSPA